MAIPYHQFSFGDALLAAASMVREDRLRREQMVLQERQFQRDLALRQKELEQQERESVRTDRTTRRGQDIERELGFAGIATTRRGQDLTFESGERDRRQRGDFHEDNLGLSLTRMTLDEQLARDRMALDERLARDQMLNAREVARISSGGSGARDLLLRIQALAALDQMGFDPSPADLGLGFDLPRASRGFTPPPPSAPHLGTAGDLNTSFWFWEPSQIVGSDERYWFPHKSEGGKVAREYVERHVSALEEDIRGRGRLSPEETWIYRRRLEGDHDAIRANPNLSEEEKARFTDAITSLLGLVASKSRRASQ